MTKIFRNLKQEHVEGLSWWFHIRENISVINYNSAKLLNEVWNEPAEETTWSRLLFLHVFPLAYILGLIVGPSMRKKEMLRDVSEYALCIYNKKNIEYFTFLEMLGGGRDETIL